MANKNGDRFSPCLTPDVLAKYSEHSELIVTQDFILLYILNITLNNLPLIPDFLSLYHNALLHI